MNFKVTISERAENNLDKVFDYLKESWPPSVTSDFKIKLTETIDHLRDNPYMYEVSSQKEGVRRCLISKHNAMYYRASANEVEIITIHDTRSNPRSLKL